MKKEKSESKKLARRRFLSVIKEIANGYYFILLIGAFCVLTLVAVMYLI